MTKRALITGGAGFIGLNVARNLAARGYAVDLVDNLSRGKEDAELKQFLNANDARFFNRDLREASGWEGLADDYQLIFHFAAIIGVKNVVENPYNTLVANVILTEQAINFARHQKGLQRFVFASTSEVYAGTLASFGLTFPTPEETPLTVMDLTEPRSCYMLSKINGEAMCHYSKLPFTIVRPHNFYGPRMGMAHVIPELLNKVYHAETGSTLDVFSADHQRTFCYIEDAAEMIVRASESNDAVGIAINIGCQSPEMTMHDLAAKIVAHLQKDLKLNELPATPGSPARRCPDMQRTKALTGYEAQVSIEDGIARTFDWYRANYF